MCLKVRKIYLHMNCKSYLIILSLHSISISSQIKSATTLRELHDLQDKHSSMLQIAGCCQVLKTLEDKSKIIDDYTQWYFIYRNHLSIQRCLFFLKSASMIIQYNKNSHFFISMCIFYRFKEGLSTLNFLCAIEQHPYVFQPFMCHEKAHLTADVLDELFRVNHSPSGSTKREEEATVLTYWRDYLIFLEGIFIFCFVCNCLFFLNLHLSYSK